MNNFPIPASQGPAHGNAAGFNAPTVIPTSKAVTAPIGTFDFETEKVIEMDLATLRRSHRENNPNGDPIRGMYHFQVIERLGDMCRQHGLNYQIEEIFAAQNRNKTQPGVSVLPRVEEQYGVKAVEAHILRRVYTTIRIDDGQNDELTTTLAIAFHQDGLQVAIGPNVKICHNQCILSPERSVADYGKGKVPTEQVFATVESWLEDFFPQMEADRKCIERLKNTALTPEDIYRFIGQLTTTRVAHDSSDKRLCAMVGTTYPLNQSQISDFTENLMKLKLDKGDVPLTLWDVYNVATELYKPRSTDFPCLIPQNGAMAQMVIEFQPGTKA